MLRNSRKILSVLLILTMVITAFTFVFPQEVNAASGLPKVSALKANAKQTTVTISWKKLSKKQQKKVKGIAIYRNNTLIKNVSKKAGSFTDSGLKAGTTYSYTVKTYKATKKKEWFNKKTKKWQKKKPAKAIRGKSRKINKYSAGVRVNISTAYTDSGLQNSSSGNKKTQTINCLGNRALDIGQNYNLGASASSGLPVTYTSNNPSIAEVDSAGVVTAKRAGTAIIIIRQTGNGTYDAAERTVTITVKSANITIKFNGNGATSGSMSNQTLTNGTGYLIPNTFTKNGYKFKGWDTNANATSPRWLDNGTFTQVSDEPITITLYAIWEKSNESTTVTTPLTFTYPKQNASGESVIDTTSGNVSISVNAPDEVKSITWSVVKVGMADGTNTVTLVPSNNGKTLSIKANNALSNRGTLGQFKLKAVFEMKDGFIYYDKDGNGTPNEVSDRTVTSPVITNTIYPMEGNISSLTWDFKSFNRSVNTEEGYYVRSLYAFKELPSNSTINININEWNGNNDNIAILFPHRWNLDTPDANHNIILTESFNSGRIYLIQAGSFKITSSGLSTDKTINFNLTGSSSFMMNYHNHLKSVAASVKTNDEVTTTKNCIAYILSHYYKKPGGKLYPDGYGDCGAGNTYLANLLGYCGIKATLRDATQEYGSDSANHNNTAVIFSDGTKYIADGTPISNKCSSMSAALTYIEDQYMSDAYLARFISWDEYQSLRTQTNNFY